MPAETQHETYQALFHENDDGNLRGRIRHDTTHIEQMPEEELGAVGMDEALAVLAEAVTIWAHSKDLSRLPPPLLPFLEDRPPDAAALVQIEVAYLPKSLNSAP
jgi:hypothetical protein